MIVRQIFATLCAATLSVVALAQPAGVCPMGATDVATAQLRGRVMTVECETWSVDFSRHTVVKSDKTAHTVVKYGERGELTMTTAYDADGQMDSKTIYQYGDDGRKRVSTTYSAKGDRTLQTLYAYTADGYLARMRFTDADAVTISTTEVGTAAGWSQTSELFGDGERVLTTYTYDDQTRLAQKEVDNGNATSTLRLTMGLDGLPSRGTYTTSDGRRQTLTFEHEKDSAGNWTRRVTYVDGTATEVAERKIEYY
ncbi:MAG: hypothetical protein PUJ24_02890 [Bacteroidales bacterium]|nr:hypothetical protein [Bacteroidales bacterium]